MLIGRYLRALREGQGLHLPRAAQWIGVHPSTLGKMEQGLAPLRFETVEPLLRGYRVPADRIWPVRSLLGYDGFHCVDSMPGCWQRLAACEGQAQALRIYSGRLIPAVLRTSAYAATVPGAAQHDDARALVPGHGKHLKHLTVILHEGALWPVPGHPEVMASQLAHLQHALDRDDAGIHILPASAPAPAEAGHALTELSFPHSRHALYAVEGDRLLYITGPDEGDAKQAALDAAHAAAAPARRTRQLLAQARSRCADHSAGGRLEAWTRFKVLARRRRHRPAPGTGRLRTARPLSGGPRIAPSRPRTRARRVEHPTRAAATERTSRRCRYNCRSPSCW
ncbi:Scr1 family TA system antitoxin-like transcriptional regulator [Streptomyces chrestomyceticus]|uniref:Scr1 family TA system antitoxin-like transcriptional regulator n=1 Tax=Streptomyces chrestomyceticus TaxID=68185 RepID=UPI0036824DCC